MAMKVRARTPGGHQYERSVPSAGLRRVLANRLREAGWAGFAAATFASGYAQALSIHDFRVTSALGEPLDAIVTIEAAPGEFLTPSCVRVTPSATGSDLPAVDGIRLSLSRSMTPGSIRLTTTRAVREPLSEIVLTIDCPGTPNISRTFMILLDPPSADAASAPVTRRTVRRYDPNRPAPVTRGVAEAVPSESSRVAAAPDAPRVRVERRRALGAGTPIEPGSTYRVRAGDSLGTIASRVAGRPTGSVWTLADGIHRANPGAFLLGDPNVLAEGAELYVPTLDESLSRQAPASATRAAAVAAHDGGPATVTGPGAPGAPTRSPAVLPRDTVTSRPVAGAATVEAIATAPAVVAASAATVRRAPLPTFVLARKLSALSTNRLYLRRTGVLEAPSATSTTTNAATSPAQTGGFGTPPGAPETPSRDNRPGPAPVGTVASQRDAVPVQPVDDAGGIHLPWWQLLLGALLVVGGAAAAVLAFRSKLAARYDEDLNNAVRRMRVDDELRQHREAPVAGGEDAGMLVEEFNEAMPDDEIAPVEAFAGQDSDAAAAPVPTVIMPSLGGLLDDDETSEPGAADNSIDAGLDLEFPEPPQSADTGGSDTTEAPSLTLDGGLDLEFPEEPESDALISEETLQLSLDGTATSELPEPALPEPDPAASAELEIDADLLALDYSNEFEATRTGIEWNADGADDDPTTSEQPVLTATDEATSEMDLHADPLSEPETPVTDEQDDSETTAETEIDPELYYHLEAAEDLGDESLGFEDEDTAKVLAFRGRDNSSTG